MNAQQLGEFKSILEAKKEELTQRIDALASDKNRSGGAISADFEEQAIDVQNDEVVDSLEGLERNELAKVEAALKRVEAGTFGVCVECGADISEKRLKAMPYSALCMDCQPQD